MSYSEPGLQQHEIFSVTITISKNITISQHHSIKQFTLWYPAIFILQHTWREVVDQLTCHCLNSACISVGKNDKFVFVTPLFCLYYKARQLFTLTCVVFLYTSNILASAVACLPDCTAFKVFQSLPSLRPLLHLLGRDTKASGWWEVYVMSRIHLTHQNVQMCASSPICYGDKRVKWG